MSWTVSLSGTSPTGSSSKDVDQQQHDYLRQQLTQFVQRLNQENTVKVTTAQFQTPIASYDVIAMKEFAGSKNIGG